MAAKCCLNVGMEKYWYLGDQVLPQVQHEYPSTTIPTPHCHTIRLLDFLADEEIARAHDGYVVAGVEGNYSEFIRLHLQGCLVGKTIFFFPSKVKFLFLQIPFPYFYLVTTLACCIFSIHLLKERKGERKRKKFPFFTILVALLIPSGRLILIFRHGSVM